jgi:hypothetical protein
MGGGQLVNTPIHDKAASLMALGKHIMETARQGKIWKL